MTNGREGRLKIHDKTGAVRCRAAGTRSHDSDHTRYVRWAFTAPDDTLRCMLIEATRLSQRVRCMRHAQNGNMLITKLLLALISSMGLAAAPPAMGADPRAMEAAQQLLQLPVCNLPWRLVHTNRFARRR